MVNHDVCAFSDEVARGHLFPRHTLLPPQAARLGKDLLLVLGLEVIGVEATWLGLGLGSGLGLRLGLGLGLGLGIGLELGLRIGLGLGLELGLGLGLGLGWRRGYRSCRRRGGG